MDGGDGATSPHTGRSACAQRLRKGGGGPRPLCNRILSAWAPLLLLHLFIDPPWENLSGAGLAGALLMGVGGEGRGGGRAERSDHLFPPKGWSNNSHVYKTPLQHIVFAKGEILHQRLLPLPLLGAPPSWPLLTSCMDRPLLVPPATGQGDPNGIVQQSARLWGIFQGESLRSDKSLPKGHWVKSTRCLPVVGMPVC